MAKRKRIWPAIFAVLLSAWVMLLSGCGPQRISGAKPAEGGPAYLTVTDDAGRTVALAAKPARIAVLSTSYLDLLYAVGGTAVGKPTSKGGIIVSETSKLAELGQVTNINPEQLLALQPDLVIAYQGLHEKLLPMLENSHIPVMLLKMKTYEDVREKIRLFGEITGETTRAQYIDEDLAGKIRNITERLPDRPKRAVILHATAKSVTVELENSIAGDVAKILHIINIAADSAAWTTHTNAVPYSLEKLVEGDPDVILITMMGGSEDVQKRLQADVESNPAWAGLRAVQNKQVYLLPADLFQLNPGIHFDKAVAYMASVVYPEVYAYGP